MGQGMFKGLNREIEHLSRDKGIKKEVIIEAVQNAFLTAARRKFGPDKEIEAHYNEQDEEIELFEFRNVVESLGDPLKEISLDDALHHDPEAALGDVIGLKMDSAELGRIAAQTAKQVIIQKIRDAEAEIIHGEYKDRKGTLIAGIIRRFEKGNVIIDLGRTEAVLPPSEQIPREHYRTGDRIQCYVLDVVVNTRGAQIVVSRGHTGLLAKLFENEVPEIYEGVVRIESAAREPGGRAKIAVSSRDSDVDPVGACVGMKGSRVQSVVQELRGEKIDIVPFSIDPARYVCNAIQPAEVSRVILDEKNRCMVLVVVDDQLSLAIGKKGQNVRLAAKLTGWRIDIHSESKIKEMAEEGIRKLTQIEGIGATIAELLYNQGITSPEALVRNSAEQIAQITTLETERVEVMRVNAAKWVEEHREAEAQAAAALETSGLPDDPSAAAARPMLDSFVPNDAEIELMAAVGVDEKLCELLRKGDFASLQMLSSADSTLVSEKTGLDPQEAEQLVERARSARRKAALSRAVANEGQAT